MNDIELEYADYLINKLRKSNQSADDPDWIDEKTHRYIEKLSDKQIDEVISILESEGWIKRYKTSTLYSLEKQVISILKEHGSYSNYYLIQIKKKEQFEEKPKSFWQKLIDFSLNGVWIWLGRIAILITIATGTIVLFQFLSGSLKKKESTTPQEMQSNQIDSIINSRDTLNISKTDSLKIQ